MGRSGLYVPLDINFLDNDKILGVGIEAELLYVRSLVLAKRLQSDGFIHRRQLCRIGNGLGLIDSDAEELVDVGLWTVEADGWRIAAWLEHNPSSDDLAAAKDAENARKRDWRDKKARDASRDGDATSRATARDDVEEKRSELEHEEKQQPRGRATQAERKQLRHAAAEVIAERRGKRTDSLTKDNPAGWLRSVIDGVEGEHREAIDNLITAFPNHTAEQIADVIQPVAANQSPSRMCGICNTENPVWCGDECPLPPPREEELSNNVTSIKAIRGSA